MRILIHRTMTTDRAFNYFMTVQHYHVDPEDIIPKKYAPQLLPTWIELL